MGRSIFVITFEEQRFLMRLPWHTFIPIRYVIHWHKQLYVALFTIYDALPLSQHIVVRNPASPESSVQQIRKPAEWGVFCIFMQTWDSFCFQSYRPCTQVQKSVWTLASAVVHNHPHRLWTSCTTTCSHGGWQLCTSGEEVLFSGLWEMIQNV